MSNQSKEHNMGSTLWQSQALEVPRISLQYVQHQAEKLNENLRRESYFAYLGILVSILLLFWGFTKYLPKINDSLMWLRWVAAILYAISMSYIVYRVRRGVKRLTLQRDENVIHTLEAYRSELKRRRDFYSGLNRPWAIVRLMGAGIFGAVVGVGVAKLFVGPDQGLNHQAIFVVVMMLQMWWMNRRRARKFQLELDALTTMDSK